jgi:protein-disulfide isomerase
MKNVFLIMIFGLFLVGINSPSAVFSESIDSPLKQMAMGISAEDVVCKSGFDLMIRFSGTAACVTPTTAMELEISGWGVITNTAAMIKDKTMDEAMKDKTMDEAMKDKTMDETMKDKTMDETMKDKTMDETMKDKTMDETMKDKTMDEVIDSIVIGGIDVTMSAPIEGSTDAPITIIEFGDFQCPKCDQWFQNEKPTIVSNYLETGIAKLYFLDLTWLGNDSISASQATYCAEDQEMYWEYHSYLYDNQGGIEDGWASTENLKLFAAELGLDTEEFDECLDSGFYSERVSHNNNIGAFHDVDGTPTFFIIGNDGTVERINGPQPASVFENIINKLS